MVLGIKIRVLRGTTMIAPCIWAMLAVLAVTATEIVAMGVGKDRTWVEALTFAAASATFCPQMALLGAKRPQNRAWHFVVMTLWAILVLPAFEVIVLHPGQALDVRGMRSWFLFLLILLAAANMLPTRFWLSGLSIAGGAIAPALVLPSHW